MTDNRTKTEMVINSVRETLMGKETQEPVAEWVSPKDVIDKKYKEAEDALRSAQGAVAKAQDRANTLRGQLEYFINKRNELMSGNAPKAVFDKEMQGSDLVEQEYTNTKNDYENGRTRWKLLDAERMFKYVSKERDEYYQKFQR
jgi:hypothetical protein